MKLSAAAIEMAKTPLDVMVHPMGDMIVDWWVTPQDGRPAKPFEVEQAALNHAEELARASGGRVIAYPYPRRCEATVYTPLFTGDVVRDGSGSGLVSSAPGASRVADDAVLSVPPAHVNAVSGHPAPPDEPTLAQVIARWNEVFRVDLIEEAAQHAQDHGEPGLAVMLRSKKP